MKRILTGDRPTGRLHLGHYVGSLANRVKLQDEYETFVFIADLHALTTKPQKKDTEKFGDNMREVVMDNLSVGIDPQKVIYYVQSYIPEVTELATIFAMLTTVPRLDRIPSIKEMMKDAHITIPSYGLLGYPVLMAADILMVRANLVPVGRDNLPHIELAREIARDFNNTYGHVFPEPEPLLGEEFTLPGTDGSSKMSKSAGNVINLSDPPEQVEKQVMGMYTDPKRIHANDPGTVEGNPVFIYLDAFSGKNEEGKATSLKDQYRKGQVGDIEVKKYLVKILNSFLDPIRKRRAEYEKNPELVEQILKQGTQRARAEAQKTLLEVKKAMKLDYFA